MPRYKHTYLLSHLAAPSSVLNLREWTHNYRHPQKENQLAQSSGLQNVIHKLTEMGEIKKVTTAGQTKDADRVCSVWVSVNVWN